MFFAGFQKLTLLDFPGRVACILFTNGCNFRCPFCHNASLVRPGGEAGISEEEILCFLKKRQGVLEGVCISGGEPLLHKGLKEFMRKVKDLGFAVKLDTNGSFPEYLSELVDEGLVDYVAMDIKNSFDKYPATAGVDADCEKIKKSIGILMEGRVEYEFRTTVVKELHTEEDIRSITSYIVGTPKYFLQNFKDSGDILCENMTGFEESELEKLRKTASFQVKTTALR